MISNDVRYMLVEDLAVGYYGHPRMKGDIDLWVDNSPTNCEAVAAVFRGFGLELPDDFSSLFQEPGKMFRLGQPPLRIEVLTGISGVEFNECYSRRQKAIFEDLEIDIITLEDLKTNKKASGRTNDIDDLAHLP